jgi:hypothetical protein
MAAAQRINVEPRAIDASSKPAPSPWEGVSPSCRRASTALVKLANLRLNISLGQRKEGWVAELRAARLHAVSALSEVARIAVLAESVLPASAIRLGEVIAEGAEDRAEDWQAAIILRKAADDFDRIDAEEHRKTEPAPAPAPVDEDDDEDGDGPLSRRDGGHRPAIECAVYRP